MSVDIALSTVGDSRFTSSKHENAPLSTTPIKIRARFSRSIAESQLKTMHGRPSLFENDFTVSVFPVPAGPCGFDDFSTANAEISVE